MCIHVAESKKRVFFDWLQVRHHRMIAEQSGGPAFPYVEGSPMNFGSEMSPFLESTFDFDSILCL